MMAGHGQTWERVGGLAGLFAGLLAGCGARPLDSDSSAGSGPADPGATAGTGATETGSTETASTGAESGETPTGTSGEPCPGGCCGGCQCYYDSAEVMLSPAEYAMWVGEGGTTGGTTGTGGETGTGGSGGASSGSTGGTTGAETGESIDTAALTPEICIALCEQEADAFDWELTCSVPELTPEGEVLIVCHWTIGCDGRRHACLRSSGAGAGGDAVTSWLARVAHDEAGSVHAFIALRRELARHGAPRPLLARLRRAAADERRHARVVDRLVRARGGRWRRPVVTACPRRELLAIAVENAVEGCVRETWAALSAAHQARCAGDRRIRAAMVGIALDEQGHAELAWAIDGWLRGRLDAEEWAQVEAARAGAAEQLRAGLLARRLPDEVVQLAGVADAEAARRLVDGLAGALWCDDSRRQEWRDGKTR